MANCMGCPKHSELMSLRYFKARIESGKEHEQLVAAIEKYKSIAALNQENAEKWKKAKSEGEQRLKEESGNLRKALHEKARLEKELEELKQNMEERVAQAEAKARKEAEKACAERIELQKKECKAEKEEAIAAVRAEMQASIDQVTAELEKCRKMLEKMSLKQHQEEEHRPTANGKTAGIPTSQTPIGQKKVIPATQRGQGLEKGGQKGHAAHFAAQFKDDDPELQTFEHPAHERICSCCGKPMQFNRWISKDTAELEIKLVKKRDLYEELICSECNTTFHDPIPEAQSGNLNYGPLLQAILVYLMIVGNMPMKKAAETISSLTNGEYTPAASYAAKLLPRAAGHLHGFMSDLRLLSLAQPILYWDDTVCSILTHRSCIRFYGTESFTLLRAHWTKSRETLDEDGILSLLEETTALMHDHCQVNYNTDFIFMNLDCVIHLIRALEEIKAESGHEWAGALLEEIRIAIHDRHMLIKDGISHFSEEYLQNFFTKFRCIIERGEKQQRAENNRYFSSDELTLLLRLKNYAPNYFAWLSCFDFPVSDNLSERGLRGVKTKLKVAGQFETLDAAENYSDIQSYVDTCRKCSVDILLALKRLMEGNPYTLKEILPENEYARLEAYKQKLAKDAEVEAQKKSFQSGSQNEGGKQVQKSENANARKNASPVLSAQEQYEENLRFMSAPHTHEEMIGILSARGDAKHLFAKPQKKNKNTDMEDVLSGEMADNGVVDSSITRDPPSSSCHDDDRNDSMLQEEQKSACNEIPGQGSDTPVLHSAKGFQSTKPGKNSRKNKPSNISYVPEWARRKKKTTRGRPRKDIVDGCMRKDHPKTGTDG